MIKVGKYTAALILVAVGSLLLIDLTTNTELSGELINWWPAVIILLGTEYLILSTIYRDPDQKMGFAIGSLILSLVLSVAVISYTTFPNFNFSFMQFGNISFSDKSGKSYDMGPIDIPVHGKHTKVHILNPNGEIEINSGDVDDIHIATTLYVSKLKNDEADEIAAESEVYFQDNGSTIEIEAKGKEYSIFGIKQKPRMDMIITVPSQKAVEYDIDMTNGKLTASDIAVKDNFRVNTTNGGIRISHIQAEINAHSTNGAVLVENISGDVTLDTTNGSITAIDVDGDVFADTTNGKIIATRVSGKLEADTTNGSINVTDVLEEITGDTTNGKITVRSATLGGDWELETTNGGIEIYLPEQANFEIKGSASRHSTIHSDFPLEISKGEVIGSVGSGEHEITIDTNSGISIFKH